MDSEADELSSYPCSFTHGSLTADTVFNLSGPQLPHL